MRPQDESDEVLRALAAAGNREAFHALVQRHLPALYVFARLTCGSEAAAWRALSAGVQAAGGGRGPHATSTLVWLLGAVRAACHGGRRVLVREGWRAAVPAPFRRVRAGGPGRDRTGAPPQPA